MQIKQKKNKKKDTKTKQNKTKQNQISCTNVTEKYEEKIRWKKGRKNTSKKRKILQDTRPTTCNKNEKTTGKRKQILQTKRKNNMNRSIKNEKCDQSTK